MAINPLARRPVDLATYRNRRKIAPAPAPKPMRKNIRDVDARRYAMNALVGWLVLAVATIGGTIGLCYTAFKMNAHGMSWLLTSSLTIVGMAALLVGFMSIKMAWRMWCSLDELDEKSRVRNQLLATVVRPVDPKPQLPFTNWLDD